jgi:hypothetical protein
MESGVGSPRCNYPRSSLEDKSKPADDATELDMGSSEHNGLNASSPATSSCLLVEAKIKARNFAGRIFGKPPDEASKIPTGVVFI